MKYGILLIGFEYLKSKRWKSLPGIPVDLYQAYRYTENISKNTSKKVLVFTDIDSDYNTTILQQAIFDGYVDSGLLSFVEDIKDKKHYNKYISTTKNGYTVNNFDKTISTFVKNIDRLIIYYTGHGKSGDIILPDDTHVSLIYLKQLIVNNSNKNCQIVSILDCCESNGMSLPFVFDFFTLKELTNKTNGIWKQNNNDFNHQEIICISSSHIEENSSATKSGSIFTQLLFSYLSSSSLSSSSLSSGYLSSSSLSSGGNKYITVTDLMRNIKGIYIHGSYPNIKLIWGWFLKSDHNNLDISYNEVNSIISIKLNNCQPTLDKSSSMTNYLRYHHNNKYE